MKLDELTRGSVYVDTNIQIFSLLPRDALHVAIVQRLGLNCIASDDVDFDRVKGVDRHWLVNPPARTV
jgi:predicted nucleic acid-binding protein